MGLGLRARRTPAAEIDRQVKEAAETLGLALPRETAARLSRGERQRVAVGRALVRHPKIYLFDEPLSSLDAQLRQELREAGAPPPPDAHYVGLRDARSEGGALPRRPGRGHARGTGAADRRASGHLPRSARSLRRALRRAPINLIEGEVVNGGSGASFQARGWRMDLIGVGERSGRARPGRALLGIRPECISLTGGDLGARVERVEHLGGDSCSTQAAHGERWSCESLPEPASACRRGDGPRPDPARAILFDPDSGSESRGAAPQEPQHAPGMFTSTLTGSGASSPQSPILPSVLDLSDHHARVCRPSPRIAP